MFFYQVREAMNDHLFFFCCFLLSQIRTEEGERQKKQSSKNLGKPFHVPRISLSHTVAEPSFQFGSGRILYKKRSQIHNKLQNK